MSIRGEMTEWAREVLADPAMVILDTETTGLRGYCCEIAVFDGEQFLLNTLVNPLAPVEPRAREIHQISDAELSAAPVFADICPDLDKILSERRVIVYDAEFDSAVINRELERLGQSPLLYWCHPRSARRVMPGSWECAMRGYSDWYYDMEGARFVKLNGGHRAGEDCKAVISRLQEMAS